MLTRPRIFAHPENRLDSRKLRGNKWFWCDKELTRFFRKNFTKKHYNNLRAIYLALCEIDSDFQEGTPIRGFKKTLCTYSGKSFEIATKYFYFLEQLELVTAQQTRDEKGYFSQTFLYLSEVEDQLDDYYADSEWFSAILESENNNMGKGYNMLKTVSKNSRLKHFPVTNIYEDSHLHSLNNINNVQPMYDPFDDKNIYQQNKETDYEEDADITNHSNTDSNSTQQTQTNEIKHINSKHTAIPKSNTLKKELTRKQLCYKEKADQLATIISSHIKINKNASMRTWPNIIEKLHTLDGVPLKRIDAALDWYQINIGKDFVPEAFSARTFRDKFPNIEQAMLRQSRKKQTTREAIVIEQNKEIGSKFILGITDAYKNTILRKDKPLIYYTDEEPTVEKIITYASAIEMIKREEKPHPYVSDFYNKVKEQEGL